MIESKFREKLPENLLFDGYAYKLHVETYLAHDGISIVYVEHNGTKCIWSHKLLTIHYDFEINKSEYTPSIDGVYSAISILNSQIVYYCTVDQMVDDALHKLSKFDYVIVDEILTNEAAFKRDLTSLINKYSLENESNTPDFILANYLMSCLRNFNNITNTRSKWYGQKAPEIKNDIEIE